MKRLLIMIATAGMAVAVILLAFRIADLRSLVRESAAEKLAISGRMAEMECELTQMRQESGMRMENYASMSNALANAEELLEEEKGANDPLRRKLQELLAVQTDLQSRLENAKEESGKLAETLKQTRDELAETARKLNELEKSNKQSDDMRQSWESELAKLKKALDDEKVSSSNLAARASAQEKELKESAGKLAEADRQLAEADKQKADYGAVKKALQEEKLVTLKLGEMISALEKEIEKTVGKLGESERQKAFFESELRKTRRKEEITP